MGFASQRCFFIHENYTIALKILYPPLKYNIVFKKISRYDNGNFKILILLEKDKYSDTCNYSDSY